MRKLNTERLKELREAKNWNWSDFARQLGTEVSTPPKWERGQAQPHPRMLARIAELFDVDVEELTKEVSPDQN